VFGLFARDNKTVLKVPCSRYVFAIVQVARQGIRRHSFSPMITIKEEPVKANENKKKDHIDVKSTKNGAAPTAIQQRLDEKESKQPHTALEFIPDKYRRLSYDNVLELLRRMGLIGPKLTEEEKIRKGRFSHLNIEDAEAQWKRELMPVLGM